MNYVSLIYLLAFLPAVLLIYRILPQRHRWMILLLASYCFFYFVSQKLIVYIILSTVSIHHMGLWLTTCKTTYLEQEKNTANQALLKKAYVKRRRRILWLGILFHIGLLLFLKYYNFFGGNVNHVLGWMSSPVLLPHLHLLLPIGISFYTLQAVSYIVDVYQGKIEADSNLGRLALYMSFFPTIMEGPICRYSQTAAALYQGTPLTYENLTFGFQKIIWGLFKKLVIADRLESFVSEVFNHYNQYGGITIILVAVLYTFQLYMDFSGVIDITIGTGTLFGVTIPENFRQPFFSKTPTEFWHRWHITLGTWFKDYIFYPVSLTKFIKNVGKFSRNKFGKHAGQIIQSFFPLFAVWICSGLWHGTGWNYIFYGMYYFVLIFLGLIVEPLVQKITTVLKINRKCFGYRMFQTIKMLFIIFTGELFFRANGLKAGFLMFQSIFTKFDWSVVTNGSLWNNFGLSMKDYFVVVLGLVAVLIVGILHEKGISIRKKIAAWNIVARWGFLYAAILIVVVFGAYGGGYAPAKLIYAGF